MGESKELSMGLKSAALLISSKEKYQVRTLLYGLMTKTANNVDKIWKILQILQNHS